MRANLRRCSQAVIALVALTACHDLGTLPEDVPRGSRAEAAQAQAGTGNVLSPGMEYACHTSMATPGGRHAYRYRRLPLRFPAEALHPRNATHRYQYRMVDDHGKVLRMANCVIPRTDRAVAMMNHRFGVPERDGQAQIQGCVSGGICLLEPIVVDPGGGDDCDPYMEADWDCSGGGECIESGFDPGREHLTIQGCGGGGDGGGGGGSGEGDDGGDSPNPGEPTRWDDGTGRPECERDDAGHCITRELSPGEWERLGAAINALPESPVECKGAKNSLLALYARGRTSQRIRFWDGYDKPTRTTQRFGQNLSDGQGRYIEYDSYHIWAMQTLLVHEGLHAWLAENPDNLGLVSGPGGMSNEDWVEQMAEGCV